MLFFSPLIPPPAARPANPAFTRRLGYLLVCVRGRACANAVGLAIAIALALALFGCQSHLAGTNDERLDYEVVAEPTDPLSGGANVPAAPSESDTASRVKSRLIGAQIVADVDEQAPGRVKITVDRDLADAVDDLMHWRGGVALYLVDPTYNFALADSSELEPKEDAGERYFVGPTASVQRAVRATSVAKGHLIFVERIDAETSRTRVVRDAPIVDLSGAQGITRATLADYGRAISLEFTNEGKAAIATASAANPGGRIAVVRSHSLLETRALASCTAAPLIVSLGRDVYAFARASAIRSVLETPTLPRLRRAAGAPVPASWGAAIACLVLPLIVSLGWSVFVRQFDRARPEPWWLVLATFALGALSAIPAAWVENALSSLSPYLNPSVMTLGGQMIGLPGALVVYTLCVGAVEEGAKFFGAWSLARHRREFDEPVDGIVYACASALGFAAAENIKYFAEMRLSGTVVAERALLSVPAHMFFGAIWGYALGRTLVSKRARVLSFFILAAVAHGAFDTLLSIDNLRPFAILLDVALGCAFIEVLRRALRYGAIAVDTTAPPPSRGRALFQMGSRVRFVVYAALLIALAVALLVAGTAFELLRHRVGIVFVGFATAVLALFGVVAYLLTQNIPLDVAIDEAGVTFAGATSRWKDILRIDTLPSIGANALLRRRRWVLLRTTSGDVHLGPGAAESMERMESILRSYMARHGGGAEPPTS